MKVSDLEEEIRHRQAAIAMLEDELKQLQTGISDMGHELDSKGKEILKIRSEANNAVR